MVGGRGRVRFAAQCETKLTTPGTISCTEWKSYGGRVRAWRGAGVG